MTRINGEKVGSMSALTRRGSRGLLLDLFDLLDPLDTLHLWLGGLAMRTAKGILIIQAERPEGDDSTGHSEFRYGSFCRRVALPESADEADIQASYDNGILEISIGLKPDQAADHAGRSIPIRLVQHIEPT